MTRKGKEEKENKEENKRKDSGGEQRIINKEEGEVRREEKNS